MKIIPRHPGLVLAGSAIIALALSSCASADPAPSEDRDFGTPVAGEVASNVLEGTTLTYAGPGGIFQDGQEEAIWQPFADASGATVLQDAFDSGKLKATVDSGNVNWDVVNTTQLDTARSCDVLYEKLDYSLLDISEVPEGTITDECMVPNVMFGVMVAYNTDHFGSDVPTSAEDFFDTEAFPGKRAVSQSAYVDVQVLEFALLAQGKDLDNLVETDIEAALDMYRSLGDDLIGWNTGAQAQQQLESGEAVMSLTWSGRGYGAAETGAPIAPMWDEWMVAIDSTGIPKGAPDIEASHAAINFYLGAEQQSRMTELNSMSPVNVNAKPQTDEILADWLANTHLETGHVPQIDFWVEHYDALSEAWAGWVTNS